MKHYLIIGNVIVLSTFFLMACTSSNQPVKTGEQIKEEVTQQKAMQEQVATPAVQTALSGEDLFNQHCKKCHKNGGNIIRPEKTLQRDVLEANNIRTPEDIVRNMRNPGKGMPKFDETKIPDKEAKTIGEYILQTFK